MLGMLRLKWNWKFTPLCFQGKSLAENWNDHRGCGLVIILLDKASPEQKILFEQQEKQGHGYIPEHKRLLLDAIDKLKRALDETNPTLAKMFYVVTAVKNGAFIAAFGRTTELEKFVGGGKGFNGVNKVPKGLGLEGLVNVEWVPREEGEDWMRRNELKGNCLLDIAKNNELWSEVLAEYEECFCRYYVKTSSGELINGGESVGVSATAIFESIMGKGTSTSRSNQKEVKRLKEILKRERLEAKSQQSHKWANKGLALKAKAKWTYGGTTYVIQGTPF